MGMLSECGKMWQGRPEDWGMEESECYSSLQNGQEGICRPVSLTSIPGKGFPGDIQKLSGHNPDVTCPRGPWLSREVVLDDLSHSV